MHYQFPLLNRLRVLVVDGDSDSRYLLSTLFQMYGIETIAVETASETLDILEQVQPDLVISEILLPDEDGFSLVQKIKAIEQVKKYQIPTIAFTTYKDGMAYSSALAAGFCRCLFKPLLIDELMTVISQLTENILVPVS
ncbi:MAG TPA: response regulator [Trichocoleus sp.]|jgi:CheY-like chemotaxis protein